MKFENDLAVQKHLDNVELDLLESGGVDNWISYQYVESVDLDGLYAAGVEQWEFYLDALDGFGEYADYVWEQHDAGENVVGFHDR